MQLSRRGFLKLGSLAATGSLLPFGRALAATDTTGFKALVCLNLTGGNDSFNMLVPRSEEAHASYAAARGPLAVPRDLLLPIADSAQQLDLGLHPSCAGLQQMYQGGRLAFLANVGTLVQPLTRDSIRDGSGRMPPKLMSHDDQASQWASCTSTVRSRGWAGRIADGLAVQYGTSAVPVNFGFNIASLWQTGRRTAPYVLAGAGAPGLTIMSPTTASGLRRREAFLRIFADAAQDPSPFVQRMVEVSQAAQGTGGLINAALATAPAITTPFPASTLGSQLRMVARLIRVHASLGHSRQLFFVDCPGFDTHIGQLTHHPALLAGMSQAAKAFDDAMAEIGLSQQVTLFSASEFGRTLTINGTGTDHGWGGHQFVAGGAVRGGQVFGRMPELVLEGPDDSGGGHIIPTTASEQMSATLAHWFGVDDADLDALFPHLASFEQRDLGFLA
jgi:uncharacterized protein (DUF1501 family)